jgi:hypothetical protein
MLHKSFFSKTVAGTAIALFLFAGCGKDEEKVALKSIEVTPAQVELAVGGTQQLTATPTPKDAADVVFKWSSADNSVATVSDKGLVTAVNVGNTTVKVAGGGIEKSVPVKVVAAFTPALEVTPADPEQALAAGGVFEFAIAANADWTYTLSEGANAWLTEATKTADALTLTVSPNATAETKTATVTFSLADYQDVTQAVAVSQAAFAHIEDDFGAGAVFTVLTATADNLKSTLEGLAAGNYIVNITGNMMLSDAAANGTNITLETQGVTVSLRGAGSATITPANDAGIVKITAGKLILRDVTLSKTGNAMPTVWITADGTLEINDGVSIAGTGETNAGVRVQGGHFLMKGGEIHGYHNPGYSGGGGIFLYSSGVFQMDGGKIYDNTAGYGGGIFVMTGNFTMNGGEFYDNHSTYADEGGGAVYLYSSNNHFEIHSPAVIYGKEGGDDKTGNTASNGDEYGHAITVFHTGGNAWKYRSNTIQNETLSITIGNYSDPPTETSGTWQP